MTPEASMATVMKFLGTQFERINSFDSLPEPIKTHWLKRFDPGMEAYIKPGMAEPGEPFNVTDVVHANLPMHRLKFGGASSDMWFVYYEHGGIGFHYHLVIYQSEDGNYDLVFHGIFTLAFRNGKWQPEPSVIEDLKEWLGRGEIENELEFADSPGFW